MKKLLVFVASLLFCCVGCNQNSSAQELRHWTIPNGKLKVLSTTGMIHDLVQRIGGDRIDALFLVRGDMDPHAYELVKGDQEKLAFAELIFYNGVGLEHGASLRYALEKHPRAVALGDAIQKTHPEKILYKQNQVDPHLWMDVSLWLEAIDPIVDALKDQAPDAGELFAKNGAALKKELQELHQTIRGQLQKIPQEKRYLVTSHDAFNYFARSYLSEEGEKEWRERFAAPEGLAPDGQIGSRDIQRIIDHLCAHQIQVVFSESNVSRDSLKKIVGACLEKGLGVLLAKQVIYGDAMGPQGSGADTYQKMMLHNAAVITESLQ